MDATSCSDCGRVLELATERHFRVSLDERPGSDTPGDSSSDSSAETVFCFDCGVVRLNTDPSLPAGAVEARAPTGARR